ncbi:MAG TPA: hypothetical protein VFR24_12965, partial [Candidatus Angelobacter sp.]|nr:hypothetical protein [Candidatus Angelobacter sp.]
LGNGVADPAREREAGLRQEVARLKQALADKVLEVDFLRGALHKVEVRKGLMSQIYLCRWEWGAGSHFMDRQLYERE